MAKCSICGIIKYPLYICPSCKKEICHDCIKAYFNICPDCLTIMIAAEYQDKFNEVIT